jgi:segregation and condensation protein B
MTRPQPIATDVETDEPVAEEIMSEAGDNVTMHPRADRSSHLRIVEALLFAASEPLSAEQLSAALPEGADLPALLADLQANYANRGVNVVQVSGKWALRTAGDLSFLLRREAVEQKRLSKAALETLAIIAYHQPVTRAEIEEIRGVAISKGTLDILLEIGWVRMRGRRRTPGRPVTYGTTQAFLSHFGLNEIGDLPGMQELRGAGLLDATMPPGFDMPIPKVSDELTPDEDPLDGDEQMPLEMHLPEEEPAPEGEAEGPAKGEEPNS